MGTKLFYALQRLICSAIVLLAATISVSAAQSDLVETPSVSAQLVFAEDGVGSNAITLSGALILDLEPGWKTYWRSPGEVGLPPTLDWSESTNIRSVDMMWPAPKRFDAFGIDNFGYEDRVVFPLQVVLETRGREVDADLALDLLVCSDICVPQSVDLSVSLPRGQAMDSTASQMIATALSTVPNESLPAYVTRLDAFIDADVSEIVLEMETARPLLEFDFFPDLGPDAALGRVDIRIAPDARLIWARFPINYANPDTLSQMTVTVVEDGVQAFTTAPNITDTAPLPPFEQRAGIINLDAIFWFALLAALGGLILNAMPCVLPVLGIKFSSMIGRDQQEQKNVRFGLLATSVGILTFMWLLAGTLIVLKSMGASVGWGIQFQNPAFLAVSITILLLFAGNMFGLFEFALPAALQDRMGTPGRPSLVGDFFTGFFAALLATPCSAPFLGSAVAFALTGGSGDILVIFTALGLGLASPYLLVSVFPGLASKLPKPGRWMGALKAVIGLLLVGTVVWLVWVMIGVAGAVAAAMAVLVGLGLIALLYQSPTAARHSLLVSLVTVIALVPVSGRLQQDTTPIEIEETVIAWQDFDRSAIARLVSRGHVVFVDVTADWCVTCKANKVLVLEQNPVRDVLEQDGIVAMQADWTRPDETISRYLESKNRFGIPFNAVYGPNAPDGIVLPEVLTSAAVIDALNDAQLSDAQRRLMQLSTSSLNP